MPSYEFRCNDTGQVFEVQFKTIADYEAATITSPFTGSGDVSRLLRKIVFKKSSLNMGGIMKGDLNALSQLGESDPRTLAYGLKAIADESSEAPHEGFKEVVSRLEAGESPRSIEKTLPPDLPLS